jgi:hypothetical protein
MTIKLQAMVDINILCSVNIEVEDNGARINMPQAPYRKAEILVRPVDGQDVTMSQERLAVIEQAAAYVVLKKAAANLRDIANIEMLNEDTETVKGDVN